MEMSCSKTSGLTMETSSITLLVSLFFNITTKTFYTKKNQFCLNQS